MSASITALLALLASIVGGLSDAKQIEAVIAELGQIISTGATEIESIAPYIKNIITALQNNGAVTTDQLTQLAAQDAAVDAAFEAAATAAGDPAPAAS